MTKIRKKVLPSNFKEPSKVAKKSAFLDTLAQSGTKEINEPFDSLIASVELDDRSTLLKRARRKYFSSKLIPLLADAASARNDYKLKKSYWSTWHCCRDLFVRVDGKVVSPCYCKQRWCLVCASIRTASHINRYSPIIESWGGKQFVTLTEVNCVKDMLPNRIEAMSSILKTIVVNQKRRHQRSTSNWKIVGFRKFECTYNARSNTYNPHFHMIVETEQMAKYLVDEWLLRNPLAGSKGQDRRFTTPGTEKELFKYEAKIITSSSNGNRSIHAESLDWIYHCIRGKRTFSGIGIKVSNDFIDDNDKGLYVPLLSTYSWEGNDWVDNNSGELLTGYIPSKGVDDLFM